MQHTCDSKYQLLFYKRMDRLCKTYERSRSRCTGNQYPFITVGQRLYLRKFRADAHRRTEKYQESSKHPCDNETRQQPYKPCSPYQPALCQRSCCSGAVQPFLPAGHQHRHYDFHKHKCDERGQRTCRKNQMDSHRIGRSSSDRLCYLRRRSLR